MRTIVVGRTLNGWQRSWVVVVAAWLFPVMAVAIANWPTVDPAADPFVPHVVPSSGVAKLSDIVEPKFDFTGIPRALEKNDPLESREYYEAIAKLSGGKTTAERLAEILLSVPNTDEVREKAVRVFFSSADGKDLVAGLAPLSLPDSVKTELRILKGSGVVPFVVLGASVPETADNTPKALSTVHSDALPFAERHPLTIRRAKFVGQLMALWLIPLAGLYVAGWSVGWIRRGFRTGKAS